VQLIGCLPLRDKSLSNSWCPVTGEKQEKDKKSFAHLSKWRWSCGLAAPGKWSAASRADRRNSSQRRHRYRIYALLCALTYSRSSDTPWNWALPLSQHVDVLPLISRSLWSPRKKNVTRWRKILEIMPETRSPRNSILFCPRYVDAVCFYTRSIMHSSLRHDAAVISGAPPIMTSGHSWSRHISRVRFDRHMIVSWQHPNFESR